MLRNSIIKLGVVFSASDKDKDISKSNHEMEVTVQLCKEGGKEQSNRHHRL